MPLQSFSFPVPETRFIKAGNVIYKFKIRGGSSFSGKEVMRGNCFNQELEEIIRTVLGNLDSLQPFSSTHFNVFPYKRRWEGGSKVVCKHHERKLKAYRSILILYLEKNMQNSEGKQAEKPSPEREVAQQIPSVSEPQQKRRKRESPLEEAILQVLMKDLETESKATVVRLHGNNSHAEEKVKKAPENLDKRATMRFDEPQQKSDVNMVRGRGSPGEVDPRTTEDMGEEERDEEGENSDSVHETPVKPGILTRLASHIFPFSLFFREA